MTYREFIDTIEKKIQERVGEEEVIQQYETMKNNGVNRIGLVHRKPQVNMSPTIYMEEFYEQYQDGASIAELVETICNIYQQVSEKPPVQVEDALDYHKIKHKIAYKLIHLEKNCELLKEVPHDIFENLAVVPYVIFENSDLGIATLQIRNEHLKSWGIDRETVLTQAVRNSFKILPAKVEQLTDYLYVITNSKGHFGAAALLYPWVLQSLYEKLEENYYILPSSVHELIAIPESFGLHPDKMRDIVREINEEEVLEEEVLSNSVYYYIGEEHRIVTYN